MLPPDRLVAALDALSALALDQVLYRAVDYDALHGFRRPRPYPGPRPLYGLGAPAHGARLTPRGGAEALYLAEDPLTATAEARQVTAALWGPDAKNPPAFPPLVLISVRACLSAVLDLRSPQVQRVLGTSEDELKAPWRLPGATGLAPTQALGALVFEHERFQAICYASARAPGRWCVAIFTARLLPPSFVEMHDPHRNIYERLGGEAPE